MLRKIYSLLPVLVFCAGCLGPGSANPFYTPEAVVRMPELDGAWYGSEKDNQGKVKRTPVEIKEEKFYSHNDDGTVDSGAMIFFKVEGALFADLQLDAGKGEKANPHLLFKIIPQTAQLTFIPLDYDWLEGQAVSGKEKISYLKEKDQSGILFTATSKEWIEFLKANKDSAEAFAGKGKFVLSREGK